jgi:hypothetical protein
MFCRCSSQHPPSDPEHDQARAIRHRGDGEKSTHYVMTRNNTIGAKHSIPKVSGRSILPLPEEVVAQIKSSTAIVSLTGGVLELLKNSLDAKATRIEATVDFARGGCTVEDDGLGISPLEFREEGGLGKLYCMYRSSTRLI